jgi:hypothetical protein
MSLSIGGSLFLPDKDAACLQGFFLFGQSRLFFNLGFGGRWHH